MSDRIRVTTQAAPQSYDAVIETGALSRLQSLVPMAHRYAVIADDTVAALYADVIARQLSHVETLTFPAGEASKTIQTWERLGNDLVRRGCGRDTCIIALGGGVTGDLAGFVAATFNRGVPVVQVPTSLLAMIDASIGGKTGVDGAGGKNLIGAFHQPHVVVIDPAVLRTLPAEELRSGLAEAVKHGAIADAAYLDWIEENAEAILRLETAVLQRLIVRSVAIKAEFVAADVFEAGARAALNFGHTVGHAIEQVTGYAVPHGFAVAMGMMVETSASEGLGISAPGTAEWLARVLKTLGLPATPPMLDAEAVVAAARSDKKARSGQTRYTVLERIGAVARDMDDSWTRLLPDDVVSDVLARLSIK